MLIFSVLTDNCLADTDTFCVARISMLNLVTAHINLETLFSSPFHEVYPACRFLLGIVRGAQAKAAPYVEDYSRNTIIPKS